MRDLTIRDSGSASIRMSDYMVYLIICNIIDLFSAGNYRIIREGHPFDDWLCEVIWPIFRDDKYIYPSSMSGIISYGLNYKSIFERSDILMAQSE